MFIFSIYIYYFINYDKQNHCFLHGVKLMNLEIFKKKALAECMEMYNYYKEAKKYETFYAFVESLKRDDNVAVVESILQGTNAIMESMKGAFSRQYKGLAPFADLSNARLTNFLRGYAIEYPKFGTRETQRGTEALVPTEQAVNLMLTDKGIQNFIYASIIQHLDRKLNEYTPVDVAEEVFTAMIEDMPNYVEMNPLKLAEPDINAPDFIEKNKGAVNAWVYQFNMNMNRFLSKVMASRGQGTTAGSSAKAYKEKMNELKQMLKSKKITDDEYYELVRRFQADMAHERAVGKGGGYAKVSTGSLDAPASGPGGDVKGTIGDITADPNADLASDDVEERNTISFIFDKIDSLNLKPVQEDFLKELFAARIEGIPDSDAQIAKKVGFPPGSVHKLLNSVRPRLRDVYNVLRGKDLA